MFEQRGGGVDLQCEGKLTVAADETPELACILEQNMRAGGTRVDLTITLG